MTRTTLNLKTVLGLLLYSFATASVGFASTTGDESLTSCQCQDDGSAKDTKTSAPSTDAEASAPRTLRNPASIEHFGRG